MKYTDLLLLDIKLIDDKAHRELTGCTNENILDLARYLDEIGKPVGSATSSSRNAATTTNT